MERIAPSRPAVAAVLGARMQVQLSVQPRFYRTTVLFHRLLASPAQRLCLGRPPEMLPSSLAGGPWGTYMPATPREKKLEIALVKLRAFQVANVSLGLPAKRGWNPLRSFAPH